MTDANEPIIDLLRTLKTRLMSDLEAVDVALAQLSGGDLVTWAGLAQHEQRCKRCGYWIFTNDQVCSIKLDSDSAAYVHRACVAQLANAEEGRPR